MCTYWHEPSSAVTIDASWRTSSVVVFHFEADARDLMTTVDTVASSLRIARVSAARARTQALCKRRCFVRSLSCSDALLWAVEEFERSIKAMQAMQNKFRDATFNIKSHREYLGLQQRMREERDREYARTLYQPRLNTYSHFADAADLEAAERVLARSVWMPKNDGATMATRTVKQDDIDLALSIHGFGVPDLLPMFSLDLCSIVADYLVSPVVLFSCAACFRIDLFLCMQTAEDMFLSLIAEAKYRIGFVLVASHELPYHDELVCRNVRPFSVSVVACFALFPLCSLS